MHFGTSSIGQKTLQELLVPLLSLESRVFLLSLKQSQKFLRQQSAGQRPSGTSLEL